MMLPTPIETFFDADRAEDGERLMQAFASDAMVRDENRTHAGHDAIAAWWHEAKAAYQHTAEPLHIHQKGDVAEVRARVSGNFPTSPATLTYTFRLIQDRIASLEISA